MISTRFAVRLLLACLVTAVPAASQAAGKAQGGSIRIAYQPPKDPQHQAIYDGLRKERALERIRDGLSTLSLPKPLLLEIAGCDGDVNAAYDPDETAIRVCYEYLAYIQELAGKIPPDLAAKESLTPANYVVGPFLEVMLHELAHAIFDLRKVPISGPGGGCGGPGSHLRAPANGQRGSPPRDRQLGGDVRLGGARSRTQAQGLR